MILIIEDLDTYKLEEVGGILITARHGQISVTTADYDDSICFVTDTQKCERVSFNGGGNGTFGAATVAPCWAGWFRYAHYAVEAVVSRLREDGKL